MSTIDLPRGYRLERGLVWPIDDSECARVAFDTLDDADAAIGLCRGSALAVQAGGNAGAWPLHFARSFNRVITFEPCPVNFAALAINVAAVEGITPIPFALGARGGAWCGLDRIEGNAGAHQITTGLEAPVMALDDLALPACDLIYLDIEGSEHAALIGALGTIARFKPVIAVEDKGLSERYGVRQGTCEELLRGFGYHVARRHRRDVILVHGDD